jgi:hypothetical protein
LPARVFILLAVFALLRLQSAIAKAYSSPAATSTAPSAMSVSSTLSKHVILIREPLMLTLHVLNAADTVISNERVDHQRHDFWIEDSAGTVM